MDDRRPTKQRAQLTVELAQPLRSLIDPRLQRAGRDLDVCQVLFDLAHVEVSTGTLKAWVDQAAEGLCEFDCQLRSLLGRAPVVHFDETGARIAGRLGWIHSASTGTLTRFTSHQKRGVEAMDDAGVLSDFTGVAVHDGWKPY